MVRVARLLFSRRAKEKGNEMSSIGNILNSVNSSLLSEISSFNTTSNPTSSANASASSGASSSDTIDFSQVGKLFQELKQLQTSDPSEFKQVLTDAATKLQAAAQQQTDPAQASFLNNLASRFQDACQHREPLATSTARWLKWIVRTAWARAPSSRGWRIEREQQ
jgi:hypothetical protein